MARTRLYDIRTIHFGRPDDPARILLNIWIQKNGSKALSNYIRNLIYRDLSNNPEYIDWKKDKLLMEIKEIGLKINEELENKKKITEEFKKLTGREPIDFL